MGMTPEQYYESIVKGNYQDFVENQGIIRLAFNAATSASHLADHFFEYNKRHDPKRVEGFKDIKELFDYLSKASEGAFLDIRSIATVYKHLYTTDKISTLTSAGAIQTIQIQNTKLDIQQINVSYSDMRSGEYKQAVSYTNKDGNHFEFLPVLERVVQLWEQILFFSKPG